MIIEDYQVLSVEAVKAPGNMSGTNWYCYTIGQGDNRITGYRQGDLASVNASVDEIVLRLNERRLGNRGRVQLDLATYGSSGD